MTGKEDIFFGFWFFIILIAVGWFYYFHTGEKLGKVNYADCREIYQLSANTWEKYYKKFICDDSGLCVHTETAFISNKCTEAVWYNKGSYVDQNKVKYLTGNYSLEELKQMRASVQNGDNPDLSKYSDEELRQIASQSSQ